MTEEVKKPITAYMLYIQSEKNKGNAMSGSVAGKKWKELSEEEKAPYVKEYEKAREKYDAYLESIGMGKKSSQGKAPATAYNSTRVRTLLGEADIKKGISAKQCTALCAVLVFFLRFSFKNSKNSYQI